MDDELNQISNEDIEMINSNDIMNDNLGDLNIGQTNDYLDNQNSLIDDDKNYILDTDTKTPGEILDEFCVELKDINSTLPDSVINHYMRKSGFIVNDPKLVKIISIASQKFISEIVNDVMQHHKLKTKTSNLANAQAATAAPNTTATANLTSIPPATAIGSNAPQSSATATSKLKTPSNIASGPSQQGLTLTLEDLSQVLTEYGINVKKPYYFM